MVKKSLTECERGNGIAGSRGSSVKGILFFLFAFAVCFGYFYFFTDVLRSKEETPGQPDVYTSEVKKPLPERLVQSAATSGEEVTLPPPVATPVPEAPSAVNGTTDLRGSQGESQKLPQKVQALPGPAKPAALPQPITKTRSTGEKSKNTVKTPLAEKKVSVKPVSGPAASKKNVAKIAHSEYGKNNGSAVGKNAPSRTAAEWPAKKVAGQFTLVVGTYVLKSSIAADKLKLEKAGLPASVMPAKMRNEPMNRLLVAEVSSVQAAREELAKVKKASKDAFYLRENNKYAIYAGSYFAHDRATQEQEHLRKLGFAPILKISQAPVSTYSLTSGSYPTRADALKGAERLKKLGFRPFLTELKK